MPKNRRFICFILIILLAASALGDLFGNVDVMKSYTDYLTYKNTVESVDKQEAHNNFGEALNILDGFFSLNKDNKYWEEMEKKSTALKTKIIKSIGIANGNADGLKTVELYLLLAKYNKTPSDQSVAESLIVLKNNLPREIKWSKDNAKMALIPEGEFIMGSDKAEQSNPDEKPAHKVFIDAYYMDKYEVTLSQFKKFCQEKGYPLPPQPDWNTEDNQPVVNISFADAMAYCQWAAKRLPTEAEWEKAARGKDALIFPWGNDWNKLYANNQEKALKKTTPAGAFEQNISPFECFDLAGNVWEWCSDWYDENYYKNSPKINPPGPTAGKMRTLRGGSWRVPNPAKQLRCANRCAVEIDFTSDDTGFRTVLPLKYESN